MGICPGLFDRQEVVALTGATVTRIRNWERWGLIAPHTRYKTPSNIGGPLRPCYTWEQVLEFKTLTRLRKQISLQKVRKVISYLRETGFDERLHNKVLVIIDRDIFWLYRDEVKQEFQRRVLALSGKHAGQIHLIFVGEFDDMLNEVWNAAKTDERIDFAEFTQKANMRPLSVAA